LVAPAIGIIPGLAGGLAIIRLNDESSLILVISGLEYDFLFAIQYYINQNLKLRKSGNRYKNTYFF
jgi:hypothetical protein